VKDSYDVFGARAWIITGVIWIVAGRMITSHLPEVEALIAGWFYWLAGFFCLYLGFLLGKEN
jgi:hypothetical protein